MNWNHLELSQWASMTMGDWDSLLIDHLALGGLRCVVSGVSVPGSLIGQYVAAGSVAGQIFAGGINGN